VWFVVALVCAGCSGASGPVPFAHVFDPCAPLAIAADGADASELATIEDASLLWREVGITGPLEPGASDAVAVAFGAAAPGVYGFYDDDAATIHVSDALSADQRAIVLAHELGHAFGLVHVTGRESVMSSGNLTIPPTVEDRADLVALWGDCARSRAGEAHAPSQASGLHDLGR